MLKKTVTYVDFNDNKRTEDCYFNLTQTELAEILFQVPGEVTENLYQDDSEEAKEQAALKLIDKLGGDGVFQFVKELMLKSYGIKSQDGRRFEKSEQISTEFSQTLAFDTLFMELMKDDVAAAEFVNGVIPANLASNIQNKNAQALLGNNKTN